MSLLEDIFLQDEANEAQELERIIEGDEFEGRPRSDSDDNSEKEDEAEEDKRKVDPASTKTRRVIKNPRFILNPARLTGPRGIQVIPDHFKDFKFKGKGHEREDLDLVLKKLEHWAYRLYPKFQFEDCLKKIETLGKKRPVMVHLTKIRTDQYLSAETVVQKDSSDEEPPPQDEFDKLLQQQIELARSTPAPNSTKKGFDTTTNSAKGFDSIIENRPLTMPKATSSPSISEEQKQRMIRNRKLAEERRLARLKNMSNSNLNNSQSDNIQENSDKTNYNTGITSNNESVIKRHNKSNVIESSEEDEITVNESIRVDIHVKNADENLIKKNGSSKENKVIRMRNEEKLTQRHESNVIESSDEEDNTAVNKSGRDDINLINGHENCKDIRSNYNNEEIVTKQQNKSNVIDSSDEDEIMGVNSENSKEIEKLSNNGELNKNAEDVDIETVAAKEKTSYKANIDKIDNQMVIDIDKVEPENENNEISTKIDTIEKEIFDKIANEDLNNSMEIINQRVNDIDNNEVENEHQISIKRNITIESIKNNIQVGDKELEKKTTNSNNENVNEIQNVNENLDDLMDVDFGDDF